MKLSGIEIIALCIIHNEGTITGYEISKRLPNSSHQLIYKCLHRLRELGIVRFERIPNDARPDRKLYFANDRKKLTELLADSLTEYPIHNSISITEIEALSFLIGIAPFEAIDKWVTHFTGHYWEAYDKAKSRGLTAEMRLRKAFIDAAEGIRERALNTEIAE